jgi:alpha-N-arabinofuranosidase
MQRSSITVKADVILDSIDPRIYGQNIEHFGRQILGGLVAEPESRAPQDDRGFRLDTADSIESLGPPLLRWPGGCFADSYRWRDGIGPDRPRVPNRMWGRFPAQFLLGNPPFLVGPQDDNRFGTDEFLGLCRRTGAEPSITASLSADDPGEAAGWVGYIRDRYGPGAVPTWSVGNEQWNPVEPGGCAFKPRKYVERFHRFAEAMRRTDPSIRLVASGADAILSSSWNRKIIRGIGDRMDYLSLHLYTPTGLSLARIGDAPGEHYAIAASGLAVEDQIRRTVELSEELLGKTLPIAFDEWNILGSLRRFVAPWDSLREAIGVAGIVHAFHRQARHVHMAAMFAMLNSASPPLLTIRDALVRTPVFHVLRMYRRLTGSARVLSEVAGPTVDVPKLLDLPRRAAFSLLDASATVDDRRLTVFVINRDHRESQEATVDISGFAVPSTVRIHTVCAKDCLAKNTVDRPDEVTERVIDTVWRGTLALPPCSVTALVAEKSMSPETA